MTKPATMPVRVGVRPVLPCNSDSVLATEEPGLTRLGQIDWPNFSIAALTEPSVAVPVAWPGVLSMPFGSACAGAVPNIVAAARTATTVVDGATYRNQGSVTQVTLVHNNHIHSTVG